LLATLDSEVEYDNGDRAPVQIKNVSAYKRKDWRESEGGIPDMVRIQILQECVVRGSDHGYAVPIFGGNTMPEPILVEWDQKFVDYYLEYSEAWWARHIVDREPVPPTLLDDVSEFWTAEPGLRVVAPPEIAARAALHRALGQQIKTLELERAAVALDVQAFMAEATELAADDSPRAKLLATWRPHANPRLSFDRESFEQDHPGVYARYLVEGKTPRPFLSK
jgi:hypothetical protein